MFYVSAISLFFSLSVFLTFVVFWSINGPEWILNIALYVSRSFLHPFSFEMRLLYLLLESLPLAIYAERSVLYGIRGKELLYKK